MIKAHLIGGGLLNCWTWIGSHQTSSKGEYDPSIVYEVLKTLKA